MRPNTKRLGAAVLALIVGAVGVVTLVRYVRTAEDRALAGQELVDVMVVTQPVGAGTSVDELGLAVETRQVPASSRAPGAIVDLDGLEGQVTSVDLVPGEQLLAARFEDEGIRRVAGGQVAIPPGLIEVTIQLTPPRAIGGQVVPGEEIAVLATLDGLDPATETEFEIPAGDSITGVLLRRALVTNVQSATPESLTADEADRSRAAPAVDLLVTLALEPSHAQRLVFVAENASIWLARESEGTGVESGPLTSLQNLFDEELADAIAAAIGADVTDAAEEATDDSSAADETEEVQP